MNKLTEALFNHQLPADLAASQRFNRQLLELVAQLEQRVAELEENAGSSSRNSSKPPSQDSLKQRARREKKPRSTRQKGAQPGHQGHRRVLVDAEAVDEQVHYYPDTQCTCGAVCDLAQEPYQRHQVFDLPEVRSEVMEHCLYDAICPSCHKRQVARLPDTVPSGQMGPGLISWITLMNGAYALSVSRIQRLLKDQWQLSFSSGAISQATCSVTEWLNRFISKLVRRYVACPLLMLMKPAITAIVSDVGFGYCVHHRWSTFSPILPEEKAQPMVC